MAHGQQAAEDAGLVRLGESIERWRRTRAKLGPMPPALWERAAAVAARLGITAVAQAMGLNASRVRAHVEARPGNTAPRFVEVSGAQVLATAATLATEGVVVEVLDSRGGKLTVRLPAATGCDVARLVEAFRRPPA